MEHSHQRSARREDTPYALDATPDRRSVTPLPFRRAPRLPYAARSLRRPLEPQHVAFARYQQSRVSTAARSRASLPSHRGDSRSRSPAKTLRSLAERDRSPVRRQGSASPEHVTAGGAAGDAEEVGHYEVPGVTGIVAPENLPPNPGHAANFRTRLSLVEVQSRKNMYSICIYCWHNDLDCDHESTCRECRKRGKSCAYVVCPLPICHLHVKCPAVHILPGLPLTDRKVGTSLHLIALLGLNRSIIRSYDISEIQAIHENVKSAQSVYMLVKEEIRSAVQREKDFDEFVVRQLLRRSDKVPKMAKRPLDTTASMIAKLVEQQSKQPYRELWNHYNRQLESGPVDRN